MKSAISPLEPRNELRDVIVGLSGAGVLLVLRYEGLLVRTLYDDDSDSAVGLVVSDKVELVLVGGVVCEITVEKGLVAEEEVAELRGPPEGRGNSGVRGGLFVVPQPKIPVPVCPLSGQKTCVKDRVG